MNAKRWPILVFVAACLLGAPKSAGATAIADSALSFMNLTISPSVSLDGSWFLEAFAHADNSLGEVDNGFASSISPDTISASAVVTWATATGSASAPNDPDLLVTGPATSAVNIPGCGPRAAFSNSRGTLFNFFTIGGTGTVPVQFSTDISGLLNVMTDFCGVFARTETIFHLDVDGTPVLFSDEILRIGPNDSKTLSFSTTLTNSIDLDAVDQNGNPLSHFLLIEADSESSAQTPEPASWLLLIAGLAALAAARRRYVIGPTEK